MIVTMSPQPYDFHYAEANQNSSSSTYNYPSAPDYMSWTATSYEYPSASTAITLGADDETIWSSVTSTSLDDPSMFASTTDSNWPQYNTPLESQNSWTPSVNPSSAVSVPDAGMWSSADYYNTPTSPYSDTAVPSNQSVSYSQGSTSRRDSTVTSFLSSARIPSASGPSSPSSYQASEAASTLSSMAKTKTAPKKKASEPKPKSTSSKRKAPSNSASSTQPSKQPPLKPSKPKVNIPSAAANGTLASEQGYQAQLLARFGSSIPPLGPAESKDPRAAADRIRREAWRICKAEALEMSQRRVKLLEHEQGALERETLQLQVNIGLMREAINKEQEELREAVGKAERLAKGDL